MKKNAAILTSYQREYKKNEFYFPSEKELRRIFNEQEIELHYVSPHYYDEKKGYFIQHVHLTDEWPVIIDEIYQPDILRVRSAQWIVHMDEMFAFAPFDTVPSMRLKHIESNKYEAYQFLKEFQPKTALLSQFYCYEWLQKEFTKRVVVKPVWWSGGRGVEFYKQKEIKSNGIYQKYAWMTNFHIVQDFHDFGKWYPGIVKWNHDVRLVFKWDKPFMNYIRQPKKWSLKSNIAWWWSQFSIPMKDIPKELLQMSKKICRALSVQENDIFTCDFARCAKDKKPYLIEINSAPWIWFPEKDKKYRTKFYTDIANHFLKICSSS